MPSSTTYTADCLIVGAGIAGLLAATVLQQEKIETLIVDKGRGVGGRMATRRFSGAVFDHGAQFFTVREPEFEQWVDTWRTSGIAVEWTRGWQRQDGHPRFRGEPGMTAIPKRLAAEREVHTGVEVTSITASASGWQLDASSGDIYHGSALLLTPPAPQALSLLRAGRVALAPAVYQALERIEYDPCFALLAHLDRPSQVPQPGAVQILGEPLRWVCDNQMKGISTQPALTIHAGPAFSRNHFDADRQLVARKIIKAAGSWLGDAQILEHQLQRWRYSEPVQLHPARTLLATDPHPLAFAGDGFYEARVEGAALSGLAAADHLARLLG